ncbi:major capsid protein P2 [Cohaesibacter celericrescens]|uniref:Uncharacterized protein n=1 Tax=Cohaesibacter celericrescens TaxID=2067669 RepID=A0A2N5XLJ2_9HYPH|nr:major capsid protein P2 [Cohaesibacter celericrescens]PLW75406.1 hypothetical protein C0081_20280 [Cohaesibacter celericrescens]
MIRTRNKLNDFTNVVAGAVATIDLPVRDRYHSVVLQVSQNDGVTKADMIAAFGRIRVKINGKDQWNLTVAELFALNEQRGHEVVDGFIPLLFSDPNARSYNEETLTAWDMLGQSTFQIDVEIKSGTVAPSIIAYAETEASTKPLQLGLIRKISKVRIANSNSGAAAITLTTLPLHGSVQALHFFETAANDVEKVSLKLAKHELFSAERAVMNYFNNRDGFSAVSGVATVRFDSTRLPRDAMPLVASDMRQHELRIDVDMANANALTMVHEFIGRPD